jgi:anti-anti-sigma factor
MIKVSRDGSRAEIEPEGDIIASAAGDFRASLKNLVKDGVKDMVIDMACVEIIDSVGLGLIISTYNSIKKADGTLQVKNVSHDVLGLFKSMRLDQHFPVTGTGPANNGTAE